MDSELVSRLDGLLHEETQVGPRGVDVTVAAVYTVDAPGRVDFGGGELAPAGLSQHERVWRDPDDDYRWWHLDGGQYLLEYNESLSGDGPVRLQTRDAVLALGRLSPDALRHGPRPRPAGGARRRPPPEGERPGLDAPRRPVGPRGGDGCPVAALADTARVTHYRWP